MRLRYLSSFWIEYEQAVTWNEAQRSGLGEELAVEIDQAIARILPDPLSWELVERDCRRVPVKRFRYSVIFQVDQPADEITIVALPHASRSPGYWLSRIKPQ